MDHYVTSAHMHAWDITDEEVDIEVAPPALSALRAWDSTNHFVLDMFQRLVSGENFFHDENNFAGSDPTITITPDGVSYNSVRATMHKVWHTAVQRGRQDNANFLRAEFSREFNPPERVANGNAIGFVSGSDANGVFTLNTRRHLPRARRMNGSRSSDGTASSSRTGVRRGNASFRSVEHGQVADVRQLIQQKRTMFEAILTEKPQWCFKINGFHSDTWTTSTAEQTINKVMEMSCVFLGIWLRFSKGPFVKAILEGMGQEKDRQKEGVGFKFPVKIQRCGTKLVFEMARVVAESRGKDPFMFWCTDMALPVKDVEIFSLVKRFEIDIKIIQAGALIAYKRAAEKEDNMAMLVRTEDFQGFRTSRKDLRTMIGFKGCPGQKRFDRRNGHCMVMVCSYLCDLDAHVDIVFDPLTEAYLLGDSHTNFTYNVQYDVTKNPRSNEGYFDQLTTSLVANPFVPRRRYAELEGWEVVDYIEETAAPVMRFIDTLEEFLAFQTELVDAVKLLYTPAFMTCGRGQIGPSMSTKVFGQNVKIDIGIVSDIAVDVYEMTERRINGMVYFMSGFYKEFEEAGLLNKVDFTQFKSTMPRKRAARIFNHQLSMNPDEDNRVDCISGFDDVSSFELNLTHMKSVMSVETRKLTGVNRLLSFSVYSKSQMDIGRVMVKEDWINKQKKEAIAVISKKMANKMGVYDDAVFRREFGQRMNDRALAEYLAFTVSQKSVTLARMKGVPKLVDLINEVFGTYAPIQDEIVHVYDPQIDEPVVCVGVLDGNRRAKPTDGHWEMDANLFYTQTMMGSLDCLLERDYYGRKWFNGSPKRAVHTSLGPEDTLFSYEADFGYAWITDVDFEPLRKHFGMNELSSWWKFAHDNPERLQRRMPCSSVIHFTAYLVKSLVKRHKAFDESPSGITPWLHGFDEKALWNWMQHEVLKITDVYFYHCEDERCAILRFEEFNRTCFSKRLISDRLKGLVVTESIAAKVKKIREGMGLVYTEVTRMFKNSGMSDKDARSATKFDFNRAIGLLKNGKYFGNVDVRASSDVISVAQEESSNGEYTFNQIPFPRDSMVQVCVRELPGTPVVLSEMIHVVPVTLAGYPKSLRIDILERARLVMDIVVERSHAFMVKTDAVFFKDMYLPEILEFVKEKFNNKYEDDAGMSISADDLRYYANECDKMECRPNKFCQEHSPLQFNEAQLHGMLPFKFVFHKGISADVSSSAIGAMGEDAEVLNYCEQVDDQPSLRKLSPDGKDKLEQSLGAMKPLVDIKTSDFMPTMQELIDVGAYSVQAAQSMGDSATVFKDRLEEHCHIHGSGAPVYFGEDEMAQPITFHNDVRNKMYLDRLFDTIDTLEGGFLMEGPPGAGKSYATVEFIKREYERDPDVTFFVATATHLTLAPYKSLDAFEEYKLEDDCTLQKRIHVCTVHSMVGVFDQFAEASRNPRRWLNDPVTSMMSRLVRVIKSSPKGTQIIVFVDEYEMLPQYAEEMLLYISAMRNIRLVLLGDRYQTAANGIGIRCTGNVVKTICNNTTIHFDLPFRNADYEYVMAQREACDGKPSKFLEYPLSNYTQIETRDDPVYISVIDSLVEAYMDAAQEENAVYRDPVVSLQNYKAVGVVTMDILKEVQERGYLNPQGAVPFCGTNTRIKKAQPNELGSVEVDVEEVLNEQQRTRGWAEENYAKDHSHRSNDPKGKEFLVGTMMKYEPGFSYRSMSAFKPKIRGTEDEKAVEQEPVRMGQVMRFVGFETKVVEIVELGKGKKADKKKRQKTTIEWGMFLKEDGSKMVLGKEEMQAYMYYPFCLYTEGVVGHTFNNYTMIKFSNTSATENDYFSLKTAVDQVEEMLGDKAWLSPVVKSLNVAVSRLTKGNRAEIIEVNEGRSKFWQRTLGSSNWHTYAVHKSMSNAAYNILLKELRSVVVKSTHVVSLKGRLEHLF